MIIEDQWRRQLWGTGACPPSTSNNFILVHFGVGLKLHRAKYCVVCEISWCRCQQLTFNQYCISHKPISHRAAAAPGPEVRRKCPMTEFLASPLLTTNPSDATVEDV